jgi:hypothetical protein
VNLAALQPYVAASTSLTPLSGRLSADTEVHYGATPALWLTGRASIADLHTVDNDLHADLVNWKRLDLEGIGYRQAPAKLEIGKVVAVEPYARVIIEPDSQMNLKRILEGSGGGAVESAAPTAAATAASSGAPRRFCTRIWPCISAISRSAYSIPIPVNSPATTSPRASSRPSSITASTGANSTLGITW